MNETELFKRLEKCKTQDEYDALIDKYVFKIDKSNRNTKNIRSNKHNILSAEQMNRLGRKEKSTDPNLL